MTLEKKHIVPSPLDAPMRILVVDDEAPHRALLKEIFEDPSHYVMQEAADGFEALKLLETHVFDLVLLDNNMPRMTGIEVCKEIRRMGGWERVPIIMVTASKTPKELHRAFHAGVTDFVGKPYSPLELETRVTACADRYRLHHALEQTTADLMTAREILERSHERLVMERNTVERIILKMRSHGLEAEAGFNFITSPLERSNGDILLSAHTPAGHWHVLVGDFTGHGLPAAAGSPIVSYIFKTMAQRGATMAETVKEISLQINLLFPLGFFMAGCFLEFSPCRLHLQAWNGGLPAPFIFRKDGQVDRIESACLPFGIMVDECGLGKKIFTLHPEDKLYLFTDGAIESVNPQGQLLGEHKLAKLLLSPQCGMAKLEAVMNGIYDFSENIGMSDDLTLVEIVINQQSS